MSLSGRSAYRVVGLSLKATVLNGPLFFRLEDYALLVGEKCCVSGPYVWKIVDY